MLTSLASVVFLTLVALTSPTISTVAIPLADVEQFVQQEQVQEQAARTARVIAYSLNVREEPAGTIVGSLQLGQTVSVVGEDRGWYLVEVNGAQAGWVSGKWLIFDEQEIAEQVVRDTLLTCSSQCWPSIDTYKAPAPQHIVGNAVLYAPGIMEATAKYRGMDLTGFVGGVAMPSMADMGEVVWLRREGLDWEGPFLVVDVSQRAHMWEHVVLKGQSVEVDFDTAVRWGMATGVAGNWRIVRGRLDNVEVYKGLQPPEDDSVAVNYREHFLRTATLGQPGQSVYWSNTMARYLNYAQYEEALTDDVKTAFVEVDVMALRLRQEPDLSARILTVLYRGDIVPVLDEQGMWVKVQFAQFTGWLHGSYVKHVAAPPEVEYEDIPFVDVRDVDCSDADPYNGYWYRGDCIPGVLAETSYKFAYPPSSSGRITYYDRGIMEQVSARYNLQGYKGGVALMSCEEVGRAVWLRVGGVVEGPYLVTDCTWDYGMFRNLGYNEIVVEVGWETHKSFVERGLWDGYVTVCFHANCGQGVWLSEYWLERVEFLAQVP